MNISKKKRLRYKQAAASIAAANNLKINLDNWEEIWELLTKYKEPEFLYFIGDQKALEVKIGRSVNPGYRLKQLQTGYPEKLYLYGFIEHKSPYTEKEVHEKFKHLRVSGEWFSYTQELHEFIQEFKHRLGVVPA